MAREQRFEWHVCLHAGPTHVTCPALWYCRKNVWQYLDCASALHNSPHFIQLAYAQRPCVPNQHKHLSVVLYLKIYYKIPEVPSFKSVLIWIHKLVGGLPSVGWWSQWHLSIKHWRTTTTINIHHTVNQQLISRYYHFLLFTIIHETSKVHENNKAIINDQIAEVLLWP